MFDLLVVHEALKRIWAQDSNVKGISRKSADDQDSLISLLIHDIFGGEILKTRKKKGWHFYNRVDGLRVDLTLSEMEKTAGPKCFEDIPSTPEETQNYFAQEDYSTFFMRFIKSFEEAVGLTDYQPDYSC